MHEHGTVMGMTGNDTAPAGEQEAVIDSLAERLPRRALSHVAKAGGMERMVLLAYDITELNVRARLDTGGTDVRELVQQKMDPLFEGRSAEEAHALANEVFRDEHNPLVRPVRDLFWRLLRA